MCGSHSSVYREKAQGLINCRRMLFSGRQFPVSDCAVTKYLFWCCSELSQKPGNAQRCYARQCNYSQLVIRQCQCRSVQRQVCRPTTILRYIRVKIDVVPPIAVKYCFPHYTVSLSLLYMFLQCLVDVVVTRNFRCASRRFVNISLKDVTRWIHNRKWNQQHFDLESDHKLASTVRTSYASLPVEAAQSYVHPFPVGLIVREMKAI